MEADKVIAAELLSEKREGFRVSAEGLLGRIRDRWKVEDHHRYTCGELLKNLEQMADRFYSGDITVVDEFLQLWCLDSKRPEQESPQRKGMESAGMPSCECTEATLNVSAVAKVHGEPSPDPEITESEELNGPGAPTRSGEKEE